jgi:hypothetical protein
MSLMMIGMFLHRLGWWLLDEFVDDGQIGGTERAGLFGQMRGGDVARQGL